MRKYLFDVFLIVVIADLFVSTISNYQIYSFVLKLTVGILLLFTISLDLKLNQRQIIWDKNLSRLLLIISLLILFPLITTIYSANQQFGFVKWLHFFVSVLPLSIGIYYLFSNLTQNHLKRIIIYFTTITLLLYPVALLIKPFDPGTAYSFSIDRWSHVVAGRFIGLSAIIMIITLIEIKKPKTKLFFTLIFSAISHFIVFSGHRSTIISVSAVLILILIKIISEKQLKSIYAFFLLSIFIVLILTYIAPPNTVITERYSNLSTLSLDKDGSLNVRYEAIKICWERFKESPIWGIGFGGFNSFYLSELPISLKYPHNLILEILVENGALGIIFYSIIFGMVFFKLKQNSYQLLLIFIYTFILAQFSKDIATQGLMWGMVGIIGVANKVEE